MNRLFMNKEFISNLFIFSIITMLFTQLRLFHLPIGIGEIALLLLGLISTLELYQKRKNIMAIFNHIFVFFWFIIFFILLTSYTWVNVMNIHSSDTNVIHDILSYGFILYSIMLFLLLKKYYNLNFDLLMERISYYSVLIYAVLLAITYCFGELLGITLNYENVARYVGLSANANQLALMFTVIPFFILYFNKNNVTNLYENKYSNIILFILSIFIVYWIASRGLNIAIIIGCCFIVMYYIYSRFSNRKILLLSIIISIIISIFVFYSYMDLVKLFFYKGIGSYTHRLELWGNAMELITFSPIIGFGPGAHVSTVVDPSHHWEVHNTFLDLLLQVGILGLFAYIFLLYKIGNNLIKHKQRILLVAFCALILFSSVHFVFRHPIFWFYLFYFYQVGKSKTCVE